MISEVKIILSARKQPLLWQKRFFTNLRRSFYQVIINLKQDELENLVILL